MSNHCKHGPIADMCAHEECNPPAKPLSPEAGSPSWTPKTDKLKAKGIEWVPIGRLEDMEREASEWKASAQQYHKAAEFRDEERSKLIAALRAIDPKHPLLPENNQTEQRP